MKRENKLLERVIIVGFVEEVRDLSSRKDSSRHAAGYWEPEPRVTACGKTACRWARCHPGTPQKLCSEADSGPRKKWGERQTKDGPDKLCLDPRNCPVLKPFRLWLRFHGFGSRLLIHQAKWSAEAAGAVNRISPGKHEITQVILCGGQKGHFGSSQALGFQQAFTEQELCGRSRRHEEDKSPSPEVATCLGEENNARVQWKNGPEDASNCLLCC